MDEDNKHYDDGTYGTFDHPNVLNFLRLRNARGRTPNGRFR